MVGIVIVSHSHLVAQGVKEMALQMVENVKIEAVGGTKDNRIGTEVSKILTAINNIYSDDGVLILFDLGSALMNAEMAKDFLSKDKRERVQLVDAPLIEGTILAAIECSLDRKLADIKLKVENIKYNKI